MSSLSGISTAEAQRRNVCAYVKLVFTVQLAELDQLVKNPDILPLGSLRLCG